jgi:hypothetical protein
MASHGEPSYRIPPPSLNGNGHRTKTRIVAIRPSVRIETLLITLPVTYNPDESGRRLAIESWKLLQTEAEIRRLFTGYTRSRVRGWWHDHDHGVEYEDRLIRYEIDGQFDARMLDRIRRWKRVLARRFQQAEVYMRLGPGTVV